LADLKGVSYPHEAVTSTNVPGNTEFVRFDNAVRKVLTVSKEELLKREQAEKQATEGTRRPKKA
jgi:hypothetical protein